MLRTYEMIHPVQLGDWQPVRALHTYGMMYTVQLGGGILSQTSAAVANDHSHSAIGRGPASHTVGASLKHDGIPTRRNNHKGMANRAERRTSRACVRVAAGGDLEYGAWLASLDAGHATSSHVIELVGT